MADPAGPEETFLCTTCAQRLRVGERSVEHPLSQALGGQGWSTPSVCKTCNRTAGVEVDAPFARETFVLAMRHLHGIPNPRGEVPPAPRLYGKLVENGLPVCLELGRDGARTRRVPVAEKLDESSERYTVETGEAEELVRKRVERIRRQRGGSVQVDVQVDTVQRESTGTIPYSLKRTLWPRFGAKIGLVFGRELLGEEWLRTPQAMHLRAVLWDHDSTPADGLPALSPIWDNIEPEDLYRTLLAPPPAHLVIAVSRSAGVRLMLQLFGEIRYAIPLSPTPHDPANGRAWIFDPIGQTARETTLSGLAEDAMRQERGHGTATRGRGGAATSARQ
jgi:hypothetical protein